MTDVVEGVSRTSQAGKRTTPAGGMPKREKVAGHSEEQEEDSVEISSEARQRCSDQKSNGTP